MGPLHPGRTGGIGPGSARSGGFRKVSAGCPRGCVGVLEGIMNCGAATAFLPKFVGFPSLRGLHSSTVQLRRAPVAGRRAPVRRNARPKPKRTGARAMDGPLKCQLDARSCRSHASVRRATPTVVLQTCEVTGTHSKPPDSRSTHPPEGEAQPPAARGPGTAAGTGAPDIPPTPRSWTSSPPGPRTSRRTRTPGLSRHGNPASHRHEGPGPATRTGPGPPTRTRTLDCTRYRNPAPPDDTNHRAPDRTDPDPRPHKDPGTGTPHLPPARRPSGPRPARIPDLPPHRNPGPRRHPGPAQEPGASGRHGYPLPSPTRQRGVRPRCGPRVRWVRLPLREPWPACVSCLRRRSRLLHRPRRRTTRLRRTSRRRRSAPRGARRRSRSLRPRPTSCRRCRGATTRWTPTPRDGPSVRTRRCGPWTPAPRPRGLRSPPG